jgi:hypothetical protein
MMKKYISDEPEMMALTVVAKKKSQNGPLSPSREDASRYDFRDRNQQNSPHGYRQAYIHSMVEALSAGDHSTAVSGCDMEPIVPWSQWCAEIHADR